MSKKKTGPKGPDDGIPEGFDPLAPIGTTPHNPPPPTADEDGPPDDGWAQAEVDEKKNPPPPEAHTEVQLTLVHGEGIKEDIWEQTLLRNGKGHLTSDVLNIATILGNDEAWDGVLRWNAFADVVVVGDVPPMPRIPEGVPTASRPAAGELTERHDIYVGGWIRKKFGATWGASACRAGIAYVAHDRPFHPLHEYLEECQSTWDGDPRLDNWLVRHLGAPDTKYTRNVTRLWMLSAVARALKPGTKVDHVLVLQGAQGVGKTSALEELFGAEWFLPELPDLKDKDSMHLLAGTWCALMDELTALKGTASVERAKTFLTRSVDVYRPPYARDTVKRPRTCVFAATTNAPEFLTDETGNRRYWPVLCTRLVDRTALRDERSQIWGEAVHRYLGGEQWWPTDDLVPAITYEQKDREMIDEWEPKIAEYIDRREYVTVGSVLTGALGLEGKDWGTWEQRRVGMCLTHLGWVQRRVRLPSGRERRYYPPDPDQLSLPPGPPGPPPDFEGGADPDGPL